MMKTPGKAGDRVRCGLCGDRFADMDRLVDHLSHKGVFDLLTTGGHDE